MLEKKRAVFIRLKTWLVKKEQNKNKFGAFIIKKKCSVLKSKEKTLEKFRGIDFSAKKKTKSKQKSNIITLDYRHLEAQLENNNNKSSNDVLIDANILV